VISVIDDPVPLSFRRIPSAHRPGPMRRKAGGVSFVQGKTGFARLATLNRRPDAIAPARDYPLEFRRGLG